MSEGTDPNLEGAGGSGSEGFAPIQTQEEFDARIKERITRAERNARKAAEAEYAEQIKKAAEYDKMQEASKSELEKANERAAKAERELEDVKAKAERVRWAQAASDATGVPVSLMHGDSEEDVLANAMAIKEFMGAQGKYPSTPNGGDPAGSAGKKLSKQEILEVKDKRERQRLMAENAELFVRK